MMRLRAVLSFNERQTIRSFLTVSNGLLLTITDRTEIEDGFSPYTW